MLGEIVSMERSVVVTHSPEETIELGRSIAKQLQPPVVVLLIGDLGTGKTTLTKGIASGLGAATEEQVTSPTFTLIHEYAATAGASHRVYHVDLYRIETLRELETLGLDDLLAERAVVIVEWGEKLGAAGKVAWPEGARVEIRLTALNDLERNIEIQTKKPAMVTG